MSFVWAVILLCLGALAGAATSLLIAFTYAEHEVQAWVEGAPLETRPAGIIYSAPLSFWKGATIEQKDALALLNRAGFEQGELVEEGGVRADGSVVNIQAGKKDKNQGRFSLKFEMSNLIEITDQWGKEQSEITLRPMPMARLKIGEQSGEHVKLSELPEYVPNAILAIEDSRFYTHEGVDFLGLVRAIVINIMKDSRSQGASTITQQLVKNLILNNSEKTYERKAREALRAMALERVFTKQQILELYLNQVYLGQINGRSVVGVAQASRAYFGTDVRRLKPWQAAVFAGIISAPNYYSPLRHPERALKKRDYALKRLAELGWLDDAVAEDASSQPLSLQPVGSSRFSPYFTDLVIDEVEGHFGDRAIAGNGLKVHTTLNPVMQVIAEKSVDGAGSMLEQRSDKLKSSEIALVSMAHKTGNVVALVGGRNYSRSQFNRAIYARRQIGSIIKPVILAALFDHDRSLSPGCLVEDSPFQLRLDNKQWEPKNYDGTFKGWMPIRDVLSASRNIPFVRIHLGLQQEINPNYLDKLGDKLGVDGIGTRPSAALGSVSATPTELAVAYGAFANKGRIAPYQMIVSVNDAQQKEIYRPVVQVPPRTVSPESAALTLSVLQDVVESGTAKSAKKYGVKVRMAAKTGTTNNNNDAWVVGLDGRHVTAVWVGFDKGRALGLTGGQAALPAWAMMMAGLPSSDFAPIVGDSLRYVDLCRDMPECSERTSDIIRKGHPVGQYCAFGDVPNEWPQGSGLLNRLLNLRKEQSVSPRVVETPTNEPEEPSKRRSKLWDLLPWSR